MYRSMSYQGHKCEKLRISDFAINILAQNQIESTYILRLSHSNIQTIFQARHQNQDVDEEISEGHNTSKFNKGTPPIYVSGNGCNQSMMHLKASVTTFQLCHTKKGSARSTLCGSQQGNLNFPVSRPQKNLSRNRPSSFVAPKYVQAYAGTMKFRPSRVYTSFNE